MIIRTHISIPSEIDTIIKNYANKNGLKYSQAVSKLIELGSSNIDLNKYITDNNGILDRIFSKLCFNTSLLEQFYSDMEIDNLTNPNKNSTLNKFKNKFNHSKYDDRRLKMSSYGKLYYKLLNDKLNKSAIIFFLRQELL